ncbi:glycoside hydrolase superfamily [Daedaleopsis nitida]|nr:glycoside hydrolase superfamily [Daedaleopsis nitida]
MYLLKLNHRNLKVLLSVGWNFDFLSNVNATRTTFPESATNMIKTYGFDGIYFDYDFSSTRAQAADCTALAHQFRQATGDAALSSIPDHYFVLNDPIKDMDAVLDYWTLRAYYSLVYWSNVTGNQDQANLFGNPSAHKITFGTPLFGQSFLNTDGLGKLFHGQGGYSIKYKYTPTYNTKTREFTSFDTPKIAKAKAYDKDGQDSLVATIAAVYDVLDQMKKHVHYPDSPWAELATNMGFARTAGPGPATTPAPVWSQALPVAALLVASTLTRVDREYFGHHAHERQHHSVHKHCA